MKPRRSQQRQCHIRFDLLSSCQCIQARTKVNVDQVSILINHDVAVVPVLDLQQEPNDAVGCHAADKVAPRLHSIRRQTV